MTPTALASRLAATAACLALTACGSTVQLSSETLAGAPQGPGQGLGVPTADGSGPPAGGQGSGATGSTGTTGGAGVGSTGSLSTGGTAGPAAPGGPGPVATGPAAAAPATKSPVEVGVVIFPDVNAFAAQFGGSADVGNQRQEVLDAVAWVNTHGGLNGHRVVPVFFEVELTSTDTYAQTYQQICSTFTQDHKVVAAILVGNAEPGLPACLRKAGSLFLTHGHYLRDASDYRQLTNIVTPEDAGPGGWRGRWSTRCWPRACSRAATSSASWS